MNNSRRCYSESFDTVIIDWAKRKEEALNKRAVEEAWASIQLDRRVEEHYKQIEEDRAWVEHRGWAYKSL